MKKLRHTSTKRHTYKHTANKPKCMAINSGLLVSTEEFSKVPYWVSCGCDNLPSHPVLVLTAQSPCLTLSAGITEVCHSAYLPLVFLTVCSAGRYCFLIVQKRKQTSAVCRLTPRHHMGCELQANFKAWCFLTNLLCLATWESMKGSFLPNRYQKYLS